MQSVKDFTRKLKGSKSTLIGFEWLDFANASTEDVEELAIFVKTTKDRHSISCYDMDWSSVEFNKIEPLFKAIKENPSIVDLSLMGSRLEKTNSSTLTGIASYVCTSNIRTLDLTNNNISTSEDFVQFLIKLAKSNVQKLICDNMRLGQSDYPTLEKIFESFISNQNLTSLSLGSFYLDGGEDGNVKYRQLLSMLLSSNISELSLPHSRFSLEMNLKEVDELFNMFLASLQLKSLDLSNSNLDFLTMEDADIDNAPEIFVSMFENFLQKTTLEEIDISNNDFSVEDTKRLIKAIVSNPNIKNKDEKFLAAKITNTNMKKPEVEAFLASIRDKSLEQRQKESFDLPSLKALHYSKGMNGHTNLNQANSPVDGISSSKNKLK